jgi:hypothetical protein
LFAQQTPLQQVACDPQELLPQHVVLLDAQNGIRLVLQH